jgi:pantetheine-phosphate adenylyltransferase
MRIGLYPGTFDPVTNGHLDIIGRAVKLVDRLVIGVAVNIGKGPLFTLFDSLLMHFAREVGAQMIVRGLRAVADFEYEFQMTAMNQQLDREIETVFLMADPRHQAIASRLVKEIAALGGDVHKFVPPGVAEQLLGKLAK